MLKILKYSFRLLLRDWRAGELRVLFIAVVLAVASVTSVGFFTDRVAQTLRQQANELLAADLVVSADRELRALFFDEARLPHGSLESWLYPAAKQVNALKFFKENLQHSNLLSRLL